MRRLGMALTAVVALLLGRASFASAADERPAVVIEEPAGSVVESSSGDLHDGESSQPAAATSPPAAPQPVWPFVLIAASVVGLSAMAVKAR